MAVRSVSGSGEAVPITTARIGALAKVGVDNASSITFISVGVSRTGLH
jgi:hypothetical protein